MKDISPTNHSNKRRPMKEVTFTLNLAVTAICCGLAVATLTGCSTVSNSKLARYKEAERMGNQRLAAFDTLDFEVYSNQRWDRFPESHAPDILVHYPDGHTTKGLAPHIEELKPMFVFAPDTKIRTHPVRIQSGEWTSVIGVLHQADADWRWQDDSADRQGVQAQDEHGGSLEERLDG